MNETETSSGLTTGTGLYWCEDFTYHQMESRTGPWSITNAETAAEAVMDWSGDER